MAKSKTRNISHKNLMDIYAFIDNFHPKNQIEERNLVILKYAYIDDLSARTISNLDDSKLVSFSNVSSMNRLSERGVRQIIQSYNLEKEKKTDYTLRNNYRRRVSLNNKRTKMNRPMICGTCGSKEKLELHHIMPIYLGGNDEYYNLIYLCHDCHYNMHKLIETIFDQNKKNRK